MRETAACVEWTRLWRVLEHASLAYVRRTAAAPVLQTEQTLGDTS